MATNTYVALDKVTLGSAQTSVTFSSIPSTYTDLILLCNVQSASGASGNSVRCNLQFNSDTSTNYSTTRILGNGTSATSNRDSNRAQIDEAAASSTFGSGEFSPSIFHIMNYSNTTTYKTVLQRNGNVANTEYKEVGSAVSLWRSTSAISTILVKGGGGNASVGFAAGSTFSLYGIASEGAAAKATGGIITSDANYFYHTFLSSGTFTPTTSLTADYLVVAGGGGGGIANFNGNATSGGGGAGGLRSTVTATGGGGSLETPLSLTAQAYTVTIGAGGNGSTAQDSNGTNGSDSVFSTITSTGGGYGSSRTAVGGVLNPSSGGSGGGGALNVNGAAGTANQGYAGGNPTDTNNSGAGGGGAGGVGGNSGANVAGVAGVGLTISMDQSITYATGGRGRQTNPVDGTANRGIGGDGGSTSSGSPTRGGNGGSGIVIVRYAKV